MVTLNIVNLIFIAVLCLIPDLNLTNATVKVYKQSFKYPDHRVIFTPKYYTSETLVYAVCDKNFQAYENHCQVIRKDHFQLSNETLSCNFTLKAEQADGHLGPMYEILAFGENEAIFISTEIGEDTFMKLSKIQLDSCNVTEMKFHVDFPYEMAFFYVVPSKNSFKVLFENEGLNNLVRNKVWIMSFDSNGKEKPIRFATYTSKSMKPYPFPIFSNIETNATHMGMFFIKSEPQNVKNFVFRRYYGTEESVSKYTYKTRKTVMSTINDLIGVCHDMHTAQSHVICTQHDYNRTLKFEFTSEDKYEQLKVRSMYNLPSGGILLVFESTGPNIHVMKINSLGTMIGSFTVGDYDCSSSYGTAATFFELENKGLENKEEYCVSIACREGSDFYVGEHTYLNLLINCFNGTDFTGSGF